MLNLLPMFGLHTVTYGVPLFLVGFSFSSRVEQHQEGWERLAGSDEWGTFDSEMDWWKTSLSPSCKRDTVRKHALILLLSFNVEQVTSLHYIFSPLMKICCIICQRLLKAFFKSWIPICLISGKLGPYPGSTVPSFCCSPSSGDPVGSALPLVSSPSSTPLPEEHGFGQRGLSLSSSLCSVGSTTIEGRRPRL